MLSVLALSSQAVAEYKGAYSYDHPSQYNRQPTYIQPQDVEGSHRANQCWVETWGGASYWAPCPRIDEREF